MGFVHDGVVNCDASSHGFYLTDRCRISIPGEEFRLWEFEVSWISNFKVTPDHEAVCEAIELLEGPCFQLQGGRCDGHRGSDGAGQPEASSGEESR